jgi:cell division protein FtsI (penicillin-binding protein 3)
MRSRLVVTAITFAAWTVAIEAKLFYLQVVRHEALVARAVSQQMQAIDVPAKRGDIRDRNGRILAYSVDAESLWADPAAVQDVEKTAADICNALNDCDAAVKRALVQNLRKKSRFSYLKRKVSPQEEERLRALNLPGVGLTKESRRFYPNKDLAAHVLGYVGLDNSGLAGLEEVYDSQVRGRPGRTIVETDAHQNAVFSRVEREATTGASLELTIDQFLQNIAERELRDGVIENRAAGGSAIIMDPWTGEILALANYPTFNPNVFGRYPDTVRRNRATQEIYEPGSTFKIVTASAALEERVMSASDPVDCAPGLIRFGSRTIRDVHPYGVLSFADVIAKSSNVGAIKVGLQLGPERLVRYVSRFGFGQTLSPDFRGETAGIVWNPAKLDSSALASVAMGYQVSVTPLQMAAAVSAVANGGTLFQPRVVRAIVKDGRRTEVEPKPLRQTISNRTALELTAMMEGVVEHGTAKTAQLDGYTVAGKTGTAAKLVNGAYSDSDYNASFVGFLPSRKPRLAVVVVIDSPHANGYYGGVVAAPIFKRIAEASLRHLGVPRTINPVAPVLLTRRAADVDTVAARETRLDSVVAVARAGFMPDVRGLSAREAIRTLTAAGVSARMNGDGFVVDQSPAAGSPLQPGDFCSLKLGRVPPAPAGGPSQ